MSTCKKVKSRVQCHDSLIPIHMPNNAFHTTSTVNTGVSSVLPTEEKSSSVSSSIPVFSVDKGVLIGGVILSVAIVALLLTNFGGDTFKGDLTDGKTQDEEQSVTIDDFRSGLSAPTGTASPSKTSTLQTAEQIQVDARLKAQVSKQQEVITALQAQLLAAQKTNINSDTTLADTAAQKLQQQIALQQQALAKLQAQKATTQTVTTKSAPVTRVIYSDPISTGEKIDAIDRPVSVPQAFIPPVPVVPTGVFPPSKPSVSSEEATRVTKVVNIGGIASDPSSSASTSEVTR